MEFSDIRARVVAWEDCVSGLRLNSGSLLVVEHVESTTPADWRGCSLQAMRALLASAARLNAFFLSRLSAPPTAWIPARAGLDYAKFVEGFITRTEPWYREVWSALQRYRHGTHRYSAMSPASLAPEVESAFRAYTDTFGIRTGA